MGCPLFHVLISSQLYEVLTPANNRHAFVRRWCKGGMQISFNQRKCPLLRRELPLFQRLLWATGYWVGPCCNAR